jgi:flagellar P-ring protein FlgI
MAILTFMLYLLTITNRLAMRNLARTLLLLLLIILLLPGLCAAARIKDIASLNGVRSNQLIGYGLITGLNGTGDDMKKSTFTLQSVYNMMVRNGITLNPDDIKDIKIKNVAAVMVTASLPPFAKPGSTIDVQVSSIGDAKSLAGGTLIMTPLKGADQNVYAVAQGALSIGAFSFGGKAAKAQRNHPTVGTIANGALIEKAVDTPLGGDGTLTYQLANADFTTATQMINVINSSFGEGTAFPRDSATVVVSVPKEYQNRIVEFVANIEGMNIDPDTAARVVVNERTGTIVMGKDVRLSTVAVSHGNLSLIVRETVDVVQPNPLADGETVATPRTDLAVVEEEGQLTVLNLPKGVSIGEIANALNAIGATPRDLIAIFQAIKASGSMHGELIVL